MLVLYLTCMIIYSNIAIGNGKLFTEEDFPNVPIGACFSYSVETTNRNTHERISLVTNFACKALTINGSGVVVLQRWNQTGYAYNDSVYSHYYICESDINILAGLFTPEAKTYGGIEFMAINATSGTLMLDLADYDWYIYDQETGLALESYKDDEVQETIVHGWLTFYSENCDLGEGQNDVPGYDLLTIVAVSVLASYLIAKQLKNKIRTK